MSRCQTSVGTICTRLAVRKTVQEPWHLDGEARMMSLMWPDLMRVVPDSILSGQPRAWLFKVGATTEKSPANSLNHQSSPGA